MEVTPQVVVNPATGEQTISYDHAVVTDNGYRDDVQRQHKEFEKQAYYESEGEIHNAWSDALTANPDLAAEEVIEQQQPQEDESEDALEFSEFQEGVFEQLGGEQNYRQMTQWAAKNWLQSDIDDFDSVMDSGDYELMLNAIQFLYNDFSNYN